MIHIKKPIYAKTYDHLAIKERRLVEGEPVYTGDGTQCGAQLTDTDVFTETALASDCDACRNRVGVGGQNDKTWEGTLLGVRPEPVYESQPYARAEEILADVAARLQPHETVASSTPIVDSRRGKVPQLKVKKAKR